MYASRSKVTIAQNANYRGWSVAIAPLFQPGWFPKDELWPDWGRGVKVELPPFRKCRTVAIRLHSALLSWLYKKQDFTLEIGAVTVSGSYHEDVEETPYTLEFKQSFRHYSIQLRKNEVQNLRYSLRDYWEIV